MTCWRQGFRITCFLAWFCMLTLFRICCFNLYQFDRLVSVTTCLARNFSISARLICQLLNLETVLWARSNVLLLLYDFNLLEFWNMISRAPNSESIYCISTGNPMMLMMVMNCLCEKIGQWKPTNPYRQLGLLPEFLLRICPTHHIHKLKLRRN